MGQDAVPGRRARDGTADRVRPAGRGPRPGRGMVAGVQARARARFGAGARRSAGALFGRVRAADTCSRSRISARSAIRAPRPGSWVTAGEPGPVVVFDPGIAP